MERTISALVAVTDSGDASAADALFAALYDELHRLAQRQLARNPAISIAAMRGLSERTAQRHWEKARLYLHDAIQDAGPA